MYIYTYIHIYIYTIHSHAPGMLHAKGCLGSRPQRLETGNIFDLNKGPNHLHQLGRKDYRLDTSFI